MSRFLLFRVFSRFFSRARFFARSGFLLVVGLLSFSVPVFASTTISAPNIATTVGSVESAASTLQGDIVPAVVVVAGLVIVVKLVKRFMHRI